MQDVLKRARAIRLVIFDVDGVLTDGSLFLGDDGQQYKAFNSKDGHGMRMLIQSGVEIAVLTGRLSQVVEHRMRDLGIDLVFQGHRDKLPVFERVLRERDLEPGQVAYAGDDLVDLPVMRRVGLAVGVQDAHPMVKQHAHWLTTSGGGRGAARELCEFIMEAQGTLSAAVAQYLE